MHPCFPPPPPSPPPRSPFPNCWSSVTVAAVALLHVLGCRLTLIKSDIYGQAETNAEAWFNIALRPRKPEGSLGRTAQDGHPTLTQLLNYDSYSQWSSEFSTLVLSPYHTVGLLPRRRIKSRHQKPDSPNPNP